MERLVARGGLHRSAVFLPLGLSELNRINAKAFAWLERKCCE